MTPTDLIDEYLSMMKTVLESPYESEDTAQLLKQYNRAQDTLCKWINLFDPLVTLGVKAATRNLDLYQSNTSTKPFSTFRMWKPRYLVLSGTTMRNPSGAAGFWTMNHFKHKFPDWWDTGVYSDGVVERVVFINARKIILHPRPSSTEEAETDHYAAGFVLASKIGEKNDMGTELTFADEEVQNVIPYVMSIQATHSTASEKDQLNVLQNMSGELARVVQDVGEENMRAINAIEDRAYGSPFALFTRF